MVTFVPEVEVEDYPVDLNIQNSELEIDESQDNQTGGETRTASKLSKKKAEVYNISGLRTRRTRVSEFQTQRRLWRRKFDENKFFKFRVISRRYMRKMSAETEAESEKSTRKISWEQEIQVVFFKKTQRPQLITNLQRHKDSLACDDMVLIK